MVVAAAKFDELFRATRVLLKECAKKNEEDRIIPTLAFANHICDRVPRLVEEKDRLVGLWGDERIWDEEADRFARRFGGLRPVRVANEVLILERRPALVTINYACVAETPEKVTINVYPHRTPLATADDVARLYYKTLSDAGIAHNEQRTVRLSSNFHNRRLEIWISPGTVIERTTVTEGFTVPQPGWRIDKASFPHPDLVGGAL